MAFERVTFGDSGELPPQASGERWLADVQNVPGFSASDQNMIDMIKGRSQDTFDMQQERRRQFMEHNGGVDIIEEQLDTLRRIFGYSARS